MNKWIIANQKNYMSYPEVQKFLKEIKGKIPKDCVIFCPSFPYLLEYQKEGYLLASQNISKENNIVTGEVDGKILSSLSVSFTLIGHTERKIYQKETEEDFVLKIRNAVQNQIHPIVGIGEMKKKDSFEDLFISIRKIYSNLTKEEKHKIWISYEPIDAIGTKKTLDIPKVLEKVQKIKQMIQEEFEETPKIFYGGSVSKENIKNLLSSDKIDGVLIGKSSCDSCEFLEIIEVAVNE